MKKLIRELKKLPFLGKRERTPFSEVNFPFKSSRPTHNQIVAAARNAGLWCRMHREAGGRSYNIFEREDLSKPPENWFLDVFTHPKGSSIYIDRTSKKKGLTPAHREKILNFVRALKPKPS